MTGGGGGGDPPRAPLTLDAFLPYRLSVTSNLVSRVVAQAYAARFGLSIPEWRLVAVLGEGEGLPQAALVRRTQMDKVAVSRAAARLAARDLVEAKPATRDARARVLALTAIGRGIYAEVAPLALAVEARLFDGLSASERAHLLDLLGRVQAAAQAQLDPDQAASA